MNKCYEYITLHFKDALFPHVENAVVLTMKNSERMNNVIDQLNKYNVCQTVHLQINDGYKKCYKYNINSTTEDIFDAICTACRYVKEGPLLILEDDVNFLPEIKSHANEVDSFLKFDTNWDIYSLGSHPIFVNPIFIPCKHVKVFSMACAQCIFLSKNMVNLLQNQDFIKHISLRIRQYSRFGIAKDIILSSCVNSYMYKIPLAVQPHPLNTENSKYWNNIFLTFLIKLFKAEDDGTNYYKFMHKTIYVGGIIPALSIILTCLFIFVKIMYTRYKRKSVKAF